MVARTLETRLTLRLLWLVSAVLAGVGVAAVAVTARSLSASDASAARGQAEAARDVVNREVAEGETLEAAIAEAVEAARAQGVRVEVRSSANAAAAPASAGARRDLPALALGACVSFDDEPGLPWDACAIGASGGTTVVAAVPVAAHRSAVAALGRAMATVVALAILALWLAVRGALRAPVSELTQLVAWTRRIVDTEAPAEPPSAGTREIAALETAFDALVRRLLDALGRARANSAHIAHELRTPLTAMSAELEAVHPADDASRAALARARGDLARLADVIEAILVLSDDRRGAERSTSVVNLADLVRELAPAGARVEAPDEALIEGDERLVSLAARNLVENAQKYGRGAVLLRLSRESSVVRLAVLDGGPGLEPAARARMFDRYWRGSADGNGRGLGLALVRAVAERHGGFAEARPGPDGHGLEVTMTFARVVGWHA
jgi:two-component system sensor histidine kinase QseC